MKTKVIRYDKCINCGNRFEGIVRSKTVNSNLTDENIHVIIAKHKVEQFKHCDNCKMYCLHVTVAWNYLDSHITTNL